MTAKELAAWLHYASVVKRALPVDDEMDRRAAAALNNRPRNYVPRKLGKKAKQP